MRLMNTDPVVLQSAITEILRNAAKHATEPRVLVEGSIHENVVG